MTGSVRNALALFLTGLAGTAPAQVQGPSSSQTPYLVPIASGVITKSIFTTGDSVNNKPDGTPYRMVGIPDGLGAIKNGDGTFTLLMNHELGNTQGVARAHGGIGAFVSEWKINADPNSLAVNQGSDLMKSVVTSGSLNFNRFCSADLAAPSAFYNPATGLGTQERIYLNGEEVTGGRAMAHVVTGPSAGTSYELASLGKAPWENLLANPGTGNTTLVIGNADATPGNVYAYYGTKSAAGTEVEKAGLVGGTSYTVQVSVNGTPVATEDRLNGFGTAGNPTLSGTFSLTTGAGTTFLRPEDGAWDPSNNNRYFFVTTDRLDQVKDGIGAQVARTRLWEMDFNDSKNPNAGGTITALLKGTEPIQMLDNIAVDKFGHIILLEDVGNAAHNGKVWLYDINTKSLSLVAQHDPARFGDLNLAATLPFNQDEESSGVIDARDILGPGWWLLDTQAHYPIAGELVEGGQLMALFVPQTAVPEPSTFVMMGIGTAGLGLAAWRRRRVRAV